jgi:hypothetical protein
MSKAKNFVKANEIETPTPAIKLSVDNCHACGNKAISKGKFLYCPHCGSYSNTNAEEVTPEFEVVDNAVTLSLAGAKNVKSVLAEVFQALESGGVCTIKGPFVNGRTEFLPSELKSATLLETAGIAIAAKSVGFTIEVGKVVRLTKP